MTTNNPVLFKYHFEKTAMPVQQESGSIERYGDLVSQVVKSAPSLIPFMPFGKAESISGGLLDPGLISKQPKVNTPSKLIRVRLIENQSGPLIEYEYDDHCRVKKINILGSHSERYLWSDNGHLLSISDQNSQTTKYEYRNGLMSGIIYPNGSTFRFTYDSSRMLAGIYYPDGKSTVFERSPEGFLVKAKSTDGEFNYFWTKDGLLQTIQYICSKGEWEYQPASTVRKFNFKLKTVSTMGVRTLVSALGSWKYGKDGSILEMFVPDGERLVKRYSDEGRMMTTWSNSGQTTYRFDKTGTVMSILKQNGTSVIFKRLMDEKKVLLLSASGIAVLSYDETGLLKADRDQNNNGAAYDYFPNRQLKAIKTKDHKISTTWANSGLLKKLLSPKIFNAEISYKDKLPDNISFLSYKLTTTECVGLLLLHLWEWQVLKPIRRLEDFAYQEKN